MKPWEDPRVARGMPMQLAKRRERIAAGEKHLGWKMGFGAPAAMEKLGLKAPLIGYLMQSALLSSGATVNVKGWVQPVAEPEIAVRLAKDIASGATLADARAAIGSLSPAVEMADLDLAPAPDNIDAVLARDIYQRHVVLGAQSRGGGDATGLTSRVTRRGRLAAETADPQALTGRLPDLLVHLANTLSAFGEAARAGDLILCGSTIPPPLIEPDEDEFGYELAPIGTVSVRFTRD
jgi:2-keto-4-pentenoate hydratase